MDYYKTYYFADICSIVMEESFLYVRKLNDFWGEGNIRNFLQPFPKFSLLHQYIDFCIDRLIYESNKEISDLSLNQLKNKKFWINHTLDYHNIKHKSFWEWYQSDNVFFNLMTEDLIIKYFEFIEYSDLYYDLKNQMIEETFFILFLNRKFLKNFNSNLAGIFELENPDAFNESQLKFLNSKFRLSRKNIPTWAKKAVFYRDRGKCTYCNKDLTGLINIANKYHIDHIVSLDQFGFNDISNLQLLCDSCNTSKGSRHSNVSKNYEKWY